VGGLKEKALAAQRNGIRCVIAPRLNEQDVEDIPEHLRAELELHFVDQIGDVFALALEDGGAPATVTRARRRRRATTPDRRAARSRSG
jgi:ATP-dependent Lon protease